MSGRPDWTVTAPLQRGLTVLEASAGTGKTWQIAHLVVRLVREGDLRVSELLVVTYTRAATAELRDRIRRRLVDAASALLIPARAVGDGGLEALVAAAAAQDCAGAWLQRLRRASEELDQATISTIHGFCQRMLRQHAFDSGADLDLERVPRHAKPDGGRRSPDQRSLSQAAFTNFSIAAFATSVVRAFSVLTSSTCISTSTHASSSLAS